MVESRDDAVGRWTLLGSYALLTYAALALHHAVVLGQVPVAGLAAGLFSAVLLLTQPLLFTAAALAPAALLVPWRRVPAGALLGVAVAGATLAQILLYADRRTYAILGFHLNGLAWNLLTTRGGIESLEAGALTWWRAMGAVAGFALLQAALALVVLKWPALRRTVAGIAPRRLLFRLALPLAALVVAEKGVHGLCRAWSRAPMLAAAQAFPLNPAPDLYRVAVALGFDPPKRRPLLSQGSRPLRYPRAPVVRDPAAPKPNLVWIVVESWRPDMLDPAIMPATSAFAAESVRFDNHYSGGNNTRMGIFTMFTGLYGPYWFPFLEERRAPVLMDLLRAEGYEIEAFTGTRFTSPEFDRTIFAGVDASHLHEASLGLSWQRDRQSAAGALEFLGRRDPARPFLLFLFLDGPHAGYAYPDDGAIRTPVSPYVDWLTVEKVDPGPVKNRYINSCHHVDTQIERVLRTLRERRLLESSIVIVTGDHGEEFQEKGHWGHASAFTEEQLRTPLLLRVPGVAPSTVGRMTSHLDLPATILKRLGVTTPPSEYSLGGDLLDGPTREFSVAASWNHAVYVDAERKIEYSMVPGDFMQWGTTTRDDRPADDLGVDPGPRRDRILSFLEGFRRFLK